MNRLFTPLEMILSFAYNEISAIVFLRFFLSVTVVLFMASASAQITCSPVPSTITGTTTVCVGSGTVTLSSPVPTGGNTVAPLNGYRVHTFTSSGTFTVPTGFSGNVQLLIVGGGGGGGGSASQDIAGGGGGAGGLLFYNGNTTVSASAAVTVGAGGAGATGFAAGANGGNSVFGSITALGGGYGGTWTISPTVGGSGGGAGENGQGLVAAAGTAGQGYAGGNGLPYQNTNQNAGGGGGGAGGVGQAYVSATQGGAGGIGAPITIAGGTATYYAGGGGGGGSGASGSGSGGAGGNGGGGAGKGATTGNGTAGTANTGGGGGGALTVYNGATATGGTGGSGIVIVAYADVVGGTWSSSNTAVANINSATGVVTPGVVGTATITYTTPSFSGCTQSTSTTFTVLAAPSITSATATANPICGNTPTIVTANGVGGAGATVTWWSGTGGTGTNYGTGTSINAVAGTYYANVTGTCTPAAQAQVSPNITVTTTAPTFPSSNNITLTGNPVNSCSGVLTNYTAASVADACSPSGVVNVLPGYGTGTGPQLWVKADAGLIAASDGTINRWKDLSGNGNDFVAPAIGNDPSYVANVINGFPVVRFTTAPKYMTNVSNFTSSTYTVFTVSKMAGTANARLISSQNVNWLLGYWDGYMNQMYANGWVIGNGGTASDANVHMYGVTGTGSLTTFYDYGNILASNASGTAAPGILELNGNNASEVSNGDIAEVIYYNRVLTATELQLVQNYLASKYNILFGPSCNNCAALGIANPTLSNIQAGQLVVNSATVNILGADMSGNKATTTGTVSVNGYAGPVVATPASSCSGTSFSMNITGMAPAGQDANCTTASGNQYYAVNVPTGSAWTVETWFKYPLPANGSGSWNTFLRGPNYHHIIASISGAVVTLGVFNGGFITSGFNMAQLSTGWHHMAAVGQSGYTTFYIDGVRAGVANSQVTENISSIGNYQGGGQPFGTFDETRIWSTALPQSTIVTYMSQAITASHPNYANLVSYYKWDGNGNDSKGANTATPTSAPTYATTGIYTYTWAGPGSPTFSPASPTTSETISVTNPSGANSGNYTVYATANGCNSTTTTIPVTVTQQPLAFTVSGGPLTVCAGGTITVSLSGTENGTPYQLILNGTNVAGVTITGNGSAMSFPSQTAAGTYTASAAVAGCTTPMTGNAVLTVNPLPQGNLTATSPICSGQNVQLTWSNSGSTIANNYSVVYTNSFNSTTATAAGAISGTAFNANPLNPSTNPTTYTLVSVTDANNCVRTSGFTTGSASVIVNTVTAVSSITANPTSPICGSTTTQITANYVGTGTALTWYTGASATGNNLGSANPLTVGGAATYYAHIIGTCNTVDVPINIALETTAPTVTAPSVITLNTSPNNSCKAAGAFSAPTVSDNCAGEVAGLMNPLPTLSNLKLWVKGDAGVVVDGNGKVAEWMDLSGNGNNFVQTTFANRATKIATDASFNNLPAIAFTTSQFMDCVNNIDGGANNSNYTIFTVSRLTGTTSARLISSATNNWLMGYHGGLQDRYYDNVWIDNGTTTNTVAHMYAVTCAGITASGANFYDYGNLLATGTAVNPNGPGQIELNGWSNGSEVSTGEVAEVIYYNTVLTTAQRQIVEGYICLKYNITVPLASLQAYETYAAGINTVNFLASDQSGNTAAATSTATVSAYPGPAVTASSGTICSQATSFITSAMAPAGQSAVCNGVSDWLNVSGSPLVNAGNAISGPNPVPIGSNWTIEEWFNYPLAANAYGGWNTLFRGTLNHHIIVQRNSAASILLGVYCNSGCAGTGGTAFIYSGFNMVQLSAGWHHLAAAGTGGYTYFYIDGVFVGRSNIQATDPLVAVGNYPGSAPGGTGGGQQSGQFDEVKIYNTALNQNAINNSMTQAATSSSDPNWSNLVAYYKLDNNGTDSKAGAYPGTLMNSATASMATALYTYNWSNTGGATFAPAASTTSESVTISGAASGNLSVYASANGCNSLTTTTPITVVPVPVVSNQTATVCGNSTNGTFNVTPSSSQPSTTYTWSSPAISPASSITGGSAQATGQTSISQTLVNTTNAAATATYTVTPTAGTCPGNTFTVAVTVNPVPAITAITTTICSAIGFTVTPVTVTNGIVPSGTTYSWSAPSVTGGMTGGAPSSGSPTSITGTLTNPTSTAQTATSTVTPFSSASLGTCQGATFTVTVTVNPTPVVTNASTASTCSGLSPNITLTANTSSTYAWTLGTNTGAITGATANSGAAINQALTNPSHIVAGSIVYNVTPTALTCVGSAYPITVTVNPAPAVTTANTASICSGTSTNIVLTAGIASNYTWTLGTNTGSITTPAAGSGSTIAQTLTNPSSTTNGSIVYNVIPTDATHSCVGTSYPITVTVTPTPAVTTANTATICTGSSPSISLTASVGSTFTWTIGTITGSITGASAGSGSTISGQILTNSGTSAGIVPYIVIPTSTTNSCPGNPYTINVTVNSGTALTSITANPSGPICATSTAQLTANFTGTGSVVSWYTGPNATGNSLGTANPLTAGGATTYYAHVTGTCNNPADISITVALETTAPNITAPVAITVYNSPNNMCYGGAVFGAPTVSDNCSGEAAGTVNPLPLPSNLKLWVKADAGVVLDANGKVAQWRDLSGNGNNFVQNTFASRPVKTSNDASFNGLPAITFSTTSQLLTLSNSLDGGANSNYTIFTVSRLSGASNQRLISSYSTNWLMGYHGGLQDRCYDNAWIDNGTTANTLAHMYTSTCAGINANGADFYDYGNLLATGTAGSPDGPGILELNGYNGGSEMSTGEVAEIIYYNTVLSTTQRQIVEGYLAYKYNLPVPLASMQAYQTYASGTSTVNFEVSDQSANTATATSAVTTSAYPGPAVTTASTSNLCADGSYTFTTSGMAPAGNYLNAANSADYLQVSTTNAQTASNVAIGTNWTIESWVKFPLPANGAGGWNTLFRGLSYHHVIVERSTNSTGLYLGCHYGGFYPCTVIGSVNGAQGFDVSTLSSGWHHIAAVGAGGSESFYVDGIFVGKTAVEITNDPIVAIGNYQGGGQEAGAMDEVKIYNTAFSQNAINNSMTQASTSSSDPYWNNLVAYYKMDGTTPVPNSSTGSVACNTCSGVLEGAATVNNATTFYTYDWSTTGGGTFAPAASTTSETVTLNNPTSGNVSFYATANSCNSTTPTPIAISVNTAPTIGTVTGAPATICAGSVITYTATGFSGGSFSMFQYQWNTTAGTWNNLGTTNPYSWTSDQSGGTVLYVRSVIVSGSCTFYSPAVSTTILTPNNAGTVTESVSQVCDGGNPVTYTESGITGAFSYFEYQWGGTTGSWSGVWGTTNPYTWSSCCGPNTLYVRGWTTANGVCPAAVSAPVAVTVYEPTSGTVYGAPAVATSGSWITYTTQNITNGGSFSYYQYQWDGTGGAWNNWPASNPYQWQASNVGHTMYVRAVLVNGPCTEYTAAVATYITESIGPCTWTGPSTEQTNTGGMGYPPCGSTGSNALVGPGTYTYLSLTGGHSYQFSTCGTSWDNSLSLWYYTGSGNAQGNNGNWAPVAWNEDNGPACTGTDASFNYDAYVTSGSYILVVGGTSGTSTCGQWVNGGSSGTLTYRENGLPTLTAAPTDACVSPGCNGSVALSMSGGCQTHTMTTGMFEQWNTISVPVSNAAYTPRWTELGTMNGNVDGSGQAYFSSNGNWSGGLVSTQGVIPSEGLTLYGRWYNSGSGGSHMVGWHDNTQGGSYTNLVYALYPYISGTTAGLQIYESGQYQGDVTSSNAAGIIGFNKWIEFKIVLHNQASNNTGATYYIRNYTGNMSDPWQEVWQSTTSSNGQTLYAGAAFNSTNNFYLDDIFVGGLTQFPSNTNLCAGSYTYAAGDQYGNISEATATVNNDPLSNTGSFVSTLYLCDPNNGNPGGSTFNSSGAITNQSVTGYTGTLQWQFGTNCASLSGYATGSGTNGSISPWNCCFGYNSGPNSVTITATSGQCPAVTNCYTFITSTPSIATQPTASQSVCVGTSVALTASANNVGSGGTVSYQWYYNTANNNTSGTVISGSSGTLASGQNTTYNLVTNNSSSVSPAGTGVAGTYYYYCVFTAFGGSGCNTATTNVAVVSVSTQPSVSITGQGNTASTALCADSTVGTTLTATNLNGTGTETWQWQIYDTTNLVWVNITGATASTFNPNTITTTNTSGMHTPVAWKNYNPADVRVVDTWSGTGCTAANSTSTYVAPYPRTFATNGPTVTGCGQAVIYGFQEYPAGSNYTFYFYYPNTSTKVGSGSDYGISSLGSYTYYVSYVDALTGCNSLNNSDYQTINVTVSNSFTVAMSNPNSVAYGGYGVSCSGAHTGSVTATVTSSSFPISYAWSTGTTNSVSSSSNTIAGLAAGTYAVTITDHSGCVQVGSITLTSPTAVTGSTTTVSYSTYGTNCNGASDGSATATGSGGNLSSYTYSWSPTGHTGATTSTYSALPVGNYTVTVTDANSCTGTVSAIITQPNPITFTYDVSYVCNSTGYTSATITVVPTGGASGTYQCQNNGGSWTSTGVYTFTGLANSSSNTIIVRDASYTSCTSGSTVITITFPAAGSSASNCNFVYAAPTGGGTLGTSTCPTDIVTALTLATGSRNMILMEAGTYYLNATLTIPANVIVDGGYNVDGSGNWYKATNTPTNIVINPAIIAVTPTTGVTVGAYVGMTASGNGFELKDINVSVVPGGNTGNTNGYGNSIYGLYLNGQTGYLISRCTFSTGAAGTGIAGSTPSGTGGGSAGGGGGGGGSGTGVGSGGGFSSNACPCGVVAPFSSPCNGSSSNGGGGGYGLGPWGADAGGGNGSGCTGSGCNSAGCNSNGCNASGGSNGSTGASAPAYVGQPSPNNSNNGYLNYFVPVTGTQGYAGDGGGGGGGGGGGVIGTCCTCSCGGGNGNGGNGGNGGAGGAGGYGGYGGGGAFAAYIWGGSGTFTNCTFSGGSGGASGSGGTGQNGNSGGGGAGGSSSGGCNGGSGGPGGSGGQGGQGGQGQSGMTGPSVGLEILNSATITQNSDGSVPNDGTISTYWYGGCPNSEITLSKTSGNNWSIAGMGSNPYYEDNLTASTSSYSNSTNTAVIYYTSGSGDENIGTTGATLNNFIRLIGSRLVPTANYIASVTNPCPTGTINLTYTGALASYIAASDVIGYDWEIMNESAPSTVVYSSSASSPGTVNPPTGGWVPGATYQVRLRLQEYCCGWSIPMWTSFTVGTDPGVATFTSAPTPVCPGSTQTYTIGSVGNTTGYTWAIPNGSGTITANSGTSYSANVTSISVIWGTSGTYNISVTPYNACGNSASTTTKSITVDGAPIPSITVNPTTATSICNGATIGLSAPTTSGNGGNGIFSYAWSSGIAGNVSSGNVSPTTTTTYSVTVTEGGSGCTASASQVITVASQPTVASPLPATQTDCNGGVPTNLTVSPLGGTGTFSYQWYSIASNANSGGTSLGSGNGANTATYTPPTTTNGSKYYYCVISESGTGCNTITTPLNDAQVTVVAAPGLTAPTPASQAVCMGGSTNISSTASGGTGTVSYQWYSNTSNSTSGGTSLGSSNGAQTTTYSPPATSSLGTTYYYIQMTATGSGCTTAISPAAAGVTVDSQLVTGNPAPATQTICAGIGGTATAITLTPTGGAGTITYQWYSNTTNSTSGGTSLGSSNGAQTKTYTPPTGTGGTTYYYAVTGVSGAGCTNPVTTLSDATVIVSELSVTAGNNGSPYCGNSTIGLTATVLPAGSYTYSWSSNPAGFTSALQNPTLPALNHDGTTYTVSATDGNCTATSSTSVSVYPLLVLNAALANCSFVDSAHINVSVDSNLVIVTGAGGVAPYTFSTPPPGSAIRDVITTSKHMYTVPTNNGLYNYTITDQAGCTATSNNVQSLNGNPTNIPYTVVNGSETLTCYDNAYGKWLTFNDTLNNAVLEIYDSSQNLGLVSVTVYKDKTSMHIQDSGYGCGTGSTYESPLQRHFVIHSTTAQPFNNQVKLRLYFSDAELDSIEKAEAANYNGTLCSQLGAVNSLSDLYVTKYDDPRAGAPTEDSLYTNNLSGAAGGIYRVYGTAGPYATYVVGGLTKDSLGFNAIYPGSQANHIHYVQLSVTEFSELWLNGAQYYNEPLPVNMLYLQAQGIDNTYIQVSWATAQEINNNHFTIERSTDSQHWDSIGIVLGHGTTTIESDYTFNDNGVVPNINYYYRLKQVDDNGNFTYTEVVTAEIFGQATFNIKGFIPNPTNGSTSLVITTSKTADVSIQLFDILGQDVTPAQNHHLAVGANQLDFDFRSLAAGTYTAVLTSGNEVYTKRLVITK